MPGTPNQTRHSAGQATVSPTRMREAQYMIKRTIFGKETDHVHAAPHAVLSQIGRWLEEWTMKPNPGRALGEASQDDLVLRAGTLGQRQCGAFARTPEYRARLVPAFRTRRRDRSGRSSAPGQATTYGPTVARSCWRVLEDPPPKRQAVWDGPVVARHLTTSVQAVCLCGARKASAWAGSVVGACAPIRILYRDRRYRGSVERGPKSVSYFHTFCLYPRLRLMNFGVRRRTSYNLYDTRTQSGLANRFYPHLSFMSKDTTDLSSGQNTDDIRKVSHNLNRDRSS